jgi:tetratricopeptide (TPR) repeat protein
MKRLLLLFIGLTLPLWAAPKVKTPPVPDANDLARQAAADLIDQGKMVEAVALLSKDLKLDARSGANAKTIAVTQSLVEITFSLYNQRQLRRAQLVAREALTQAIPVTKTLRSEDGIPELYMLLGQVCEEVLYDLPVAQSYYQAALAMQPAHARAQQRLSQVKDSQEKQQRSKAGRP